MSGPLVLTAPYYELLEELERRHWWCRSVRRTALGLIGPALSRDSVVLDAGCGAGGFLEQLGEWHPRARGIGVDLSADALHLAREKGLKRLLLASVMDLPVASESVDVLVSNDVLQHLPNEEDVRALAEARRVLKPEGLFCVRANFGSPEAAGPGLHRRYNRESLAVLVRGAGFQITRHLVLHAIPALAGRLRRSSDPPGSHAADAHGRGLTMRVPAAPVNALLDLYVRAEDALARVLPLPFPAGDTQILLARRPV